MNLFKVIYLNALAFKQCYLVDCIVEILVNNCPNTIASLID